MSVNFPNSVSKTSTDFQLQPPEREINEEMRHIRISPEFSIPCSRAPSNFEGKKTRNRITKEKLLFRKLCPMKSGGPTFVHTLTILIDQPSDFPACPLESGSV